MNHQTDLDVHDMVRELTSAHDHREPYVPDRENGEVWEAKHHTTVPALIHQLVEATDQTNGSGAETGGTPRSKPAARIEAMDIVWLIDFEAGDWIYRLGENIPGDRLHPQTMRPIVGSGTIRRLRRLNGLYPSMSSCGREKGRHSRPKKGVAWCCAQGHLENDVKRWWTQARIISGWDTPAFRPHATCPVCDASDTLRVKLEGASCVECQSLWGAAEVGLLGEHVRLELERKAAEQLEQRAG